MWLPRADGVHGSPQRLLLMTPCSRRCSLSFVVRFTCAFAIFVAFTVAFQGFYELLLSRYTTTTTTSSMSSMNDRSLAAEMALRVRIFCIIITESHRHESFATYAKLSWTRHCNRAVFVSDEENIVIEPFAFGTKQKWAKVHLGLETIYRRYGSEYDWFLKADDNSFFILENLRNYLSDFSPHTPMYVGCEFKSNLNVSFMNGPSGYVLSREALHRFVTHALPNETLCISTDFGNEDEEIGNCLRNVGVEAHDGRDASGNLLFVPLTTKEIFEGIDADKEQWLEERSFAIEQIQNLRLLSRHLISFIVPNDKDMFAIEFFIHKLRLFGNNQ